jgi:hypothetical protein
MTVKEKNLLKIMLAIVVLGFMFKGVPFAYETYQQRKSDIKTVKDKKQRLKHLISQKDYWQVEHDNTLKQKALLEKELFTANSNELVAAKVQAVIKELARQSDVRVESMLLAEFQQSADWLLVSLSITIKANANNVINLLHKIGANKQKLLIKEISFRSYNNVLNGTITLVGFSHSVKKPLATKDGD